MKAMLSLVNTMMKSEVADAMKDMAENTKLFNSFTVESANAKTLSIVIVDDDDETMPINFFRK